MNNSNDMEMYEDYEKASQDVFLPFVEDERYRLVEAPKSPTRSNSLPDEVLLASIDDDLEAKAKEEACEAFRQRPVYECGSKTIIQKRAWSGEYRIRTQVNPANAPSPPMQSGDRVSNILSDRGARKIADSCSFTASQGRGFTTFLTGTINPEARAKLTTFDIKTGKPLTTIQKEVTRTMDGMQKMFQRGWTDENTGEVIPGHDYPLAYTWVVEIPENSEGEKNPHIHVLLDWRVDFKHFKEWSRRLEALWGNGYFHLEKINDPLCAGAYMAKAAGYISKANGQNDQGEVTGNRYGISKRARAPDWYTISEHELGIMGSVIRDIFDAIELKHGDKFRKRRELNQELEGIKILAKAEKQKTGVDPYWAKNKREKIGKELATVRSDINALPVRASKYQIVMNEDMLPWFLGWSLAMGWKPNKRPDSQELANFKKENFFRKQRRGAATNDQLVSILEKNQSYKEETLSASNEFYSEASKGWCFLDREDWRSDFGFV